jgi:hypothetical protein
MGRPVQEDDGAEAALELGLDRSHAEGKKRGTVKQAN